MERKHRLTRSIDFKRVRRTGSSLAHPLAVLIYLRNGLGTTRIGVSAAKSLGNAVKRNRAKRRLREALRNCLPEIASGWDIVAIARPESLNAEWSRLQDMIRNQLREAELLIETS
ncbi:MAG: ribonuclease P protein component [Anaerolineales bacterium]|jgi:ribonuclease P protein component